MLQNNKSLTQLVQEDASVSFTKTANAMLSTILQRSFDEVYPFSSQEVVLQVLHQCKGIQNKTAKTVLVVDDLAGQLVKPLQKAGYDVTLAISRIHKNDINKDKAIKMLKTMQKYKRGFEADIVLLDDLIEDRV